MRKARKQEHIENYLVTSFENDNLFNDVYIEHSAIAERNFSDIDTSTTFIGHKISFPFMINAVTGGNEYANEINKDLARIARELRIPMAVGSQTIAIEEPEVEDSFKIVRKENKNGIIIGNLSALTTVENAKKAVEMLNANALQLHLNMAQELVMPEGDRDFTEVLNNIEAIVKEVHIPIIVKEVGTGISKSVAKKLYDVGVRFIDVAGLGGSNFIEIENLRNPDLDSYEMYDWGIPTALSLLEVVSLDKNDLFIISSGGVNTATEIAKSLALGGDLCANSGEVINYLIRGEYEEAYRYIKNLRHKLKIIMMLLDIEKIKDFKKVKYKLTGKLKDLYE